MNYSKEENKTKETSKKSIELIYTDLSIKENKNKLIMLISLLDFFGRGCSLFFYLIFGDHNLDEHHFNWIISIDFLSRVLFSKLFFKTKLYKHHKRSLILCIFGFGILFCYAMDSILFDYDREKEVYIYNKLKNWIFLLFVIIQKILFSLEDSISKMVLFDKFFLPHFLMFWKGVYSLILYLILVIILFSTSSVKFSNYQELFGGEKSNLQIVSDLIIIIFGFFEGISIFNIIYTFTPIHVGFLNVVSSFLHIVLFTFSIIEKGFYWHITLDIISMIFIGFGTLIFTEIIVLNFWGMNENTKTGLMLKEKLENIEENSNLLINNEEENNDNSEENKNYKNV